MIAAALPLLGLAALVTARNCQNFTIPLDISSRNGVFDIQSPKSDVDVTDFMLNLSQQGSNYTDDILKGYKTVSGHYEVAATYCQPDHGPSKVLQILTHGVGFDRSYWDLSFANFNYSYVKTAVDDYGYSTFAYDRLGLGESSHGEPISEIQSWLELAALRALTQKLRAGEVSEVGDASSAFEKVVHVGHSFGSILSYSLTSDDENECVSDGIVLTGFTHNDTFVPSFLLGGDFVRANTLRGLEDYADGHVAPATRSAVQTNFFAPGEFDVDMLDAAFANGQPATYGEFLTLSAFAGNPSKFTGPALVITGDRDIPFCGGDCSATGIPELPSLLDMSEMMLPQAEPFESHVVPRAGHALAMEYSHVETTGKILDFLTQNGLAAQ